MTELIGQTLGNCRVEALLGAGGMAQVYRGVHIHLDRPVAIKVMLAHLAADPGFRARFLQEGKAVASLSHPNIVEVFDFGEQEERLYLIMELMTGGAMRELLQQQAGHDQTRSLGLGLDLVGQAAAGLAYAHARGMVHRDIKPDNLLLRKYAASEATPEHMYAVKISDFGLARVAEGGLLTATGLTMGTPAYMSPEQCQGLELDGRSDLYSLGVVLYEVTTGALPFAAKSLTEAVYKHVYTEPPRPRQIRPNIAPALEAVILRCLAKRPAERYATAAELVRALQDAQSAQLILPADGATIVATPPPRLAAGGDSTRSGPPARAGGGNPAEDAPAAVVTPPDPNIAPVTVLRSPAPLTTPPEVPSLFGRLAVPQVRVFDAGGQLQQTVTLTGDGITVGRVPGNSVVLDDPSISRHHLRIDWDGEQVTATDLGSANGTALGDIRILPQVAQFWSAEAWLRLGPFQLLLELPTSIPGIISRAGATTPPPPPPPMDGGRIGVAIEHDTLSLVPGQPTIVKATLANLGNTVDHLTVTVEGIPSAWVTGPDRPVQLNPHGQATVALTVNAPRAPGSYAGQYPVTLRARSRENPNESGVATALWTVLPFEAPTSTLTPQRAGGRTRAQYVLQLGNGGNMPARYELHGRDEEQRLRFRFQQETVALDPFRSTTVPLLVTTPWRLLGRPIDHKFTIQTRSATAPQPLSTTGEFVHNALLPAWVVAIPPVLVAIYLLLRTLLQPSIDNFQPVPLNPVAGQPFYLTWQVHRAQQLEVLPEHIKVDPKTDRYIFPHGVDNPEALTLVASNVFGRVQKKQDVTVLQATATPTAVIPTATATSVPPTATVTPEPGAPVIQRWQATAANGKALDAATLEVPPNTLVTLTWQVTSADAVEIDGIGTVEQSGSVQRAVPASTTFTLKASNKGIHPVSRAIQIIVVAPTAVPTATPRPTATPLSTAVPPTATVSAPANGGAAGGAPPVPIGGGTSGTAPPPAAAGAWTALAVSRDTAGNDVLWSANTTDNVVRRIDVQARTQTLLPVGKAPDSLLVTETALWVANSGDGTVQRLDLQTGRQIGTPIAVGKKPTAMALTKDNSGKDVILVANADDGTVQRIDAQTGKAQPAVPVAKAITALAAGKDSLWVAVGADNTVRRLPLQDGRPNGPAVTIAVGKRPSALAILRDASGKETVWVADLDGGSIQPIDATTNHAGPATPVGKGPSSLAIMTEASGRIFIWVANSAEATVQAIDSQSGKVVATAPVPTNPGSVAAGKDQIWVLNQGTGNVQGVRVNG